MTPHISTTLLRTQSDERLVRLAADGHERAFEAIVERYRRPLTRFAQRYVGEARAEEVVQTAFLNAWNSLRSGTDVHDLKPWLYRIVNNGAINAMQKAEYGDAPLIEASDARLGPEAAYEQSEELKLTVQSISELPDRQREALLAVAVDGRAHADVATELGVSDAGVRQLVRRARVQLRAAATAITPLPLAVWLADGGLAGFGSAAKAGAVAVGHRTAELGAGAGGTGGSAVAGAVKTGVAVVGVAAVAAGGTEAVREVKKDSSSSQPSVTASSPARERMLIPGLDPSTMRAGGVPQVRVVTGPDGRPRLVAQAPGSSPSVPGSDPRSYDMPMPAPPIDSPGRQDGSQQYAGLFDGTMPAPPSNRGGGGRRGGGAPRQVAETGPGSGGAPSGLPGGNSPAGNPSQGQGGGGRDSGGNSGGGGSKGEDRPGNSGGGGENPGGGNGGGKSEDRPGNSGGGENSGGGNGGGGKSEDRPGNSGGGKGNGGGKGRGGN